MRRPTPLILLGATIVMLVAGCTATAPLPAKTVSASPRASATPAPSAAPTPSITPAIGCPPTPNSSMPTRAISLTTIDVDGDGRPDTEWIATVDRATEFGVTTASGATFAYSVNSASPISPGGFLARLSPTRVISMLTDGRQAYLHVISKCSFVQPVSSDGKPYTFDLHNLRGYGTGVGCIAADNGAEVVGYQATPHNGGTTVKQTIIQMDAAGTGARNGAVSTVASGVAANSPIAALAYSVTCGSVSVPIGGVTLTQ